VITEQWVVTENFMNNPVILLNRRRENNFTFYHKMNGQWLLIRLKRRKNMFAGGMNFTTLNLPRVDDLVVKISVSSVDCRLQNGKERRA
jgi:hypothetical protein